MANRVNNEIAIEEVRDRVRIGILTVREDEFKAVQSKIRGQRPVAGAWLYIYGNIPVNGIPEIPVVVARCDDKGHASAQEVATTMINDFNVSWLLLVGIAGGLPDSEYSLGDVLVATRFVDFSLTAAHDEKTQNNVRGGDFHPAVRALVAFLPAAESTLIKSWNKSGTLKRPRLDVPSDISDTRLYGAVDWRKSVVQSLQANFGASAGRRRPRIHTSPIATSNILGKDSKLASQWREFAKDVTHIEMELGGVYRASIATRSKDCRILSIRGISDIVGFKREAHWTGFACNSAAALAVSIVKSHFTELADKTVEPSHEASEASNPTRLTVDEHGFHVSYSADIPSFSLPKSFPSGDTASITEEDARHWKRVHTLSEKCHRHFKFLDETLRAYQSTKGANREDAQHIAMRALEFAWPALTEFEESVVAMPKAMHESQPIIALVNDIGKCQGILWRSLAIDQPGGDFVNTVELVRHIDNWCLECLRRADAYLEAYFNGHAV